MVTDTTRFENRIDKANQFEIIIQTFEAFIKHEATSFADLQAYLQACKTHYSKFVISESTYEEKNTLRYQRYHEDEDGLMKRLKYFNKYLRGKTAIDARIRERVSAIIRKLRGVSSKRLKNVAVQTTDKTEQDDAVKDRVQHTGGYGIKLGFLEKIEKSLVGLGPTYTPMNPLIQLQSIAALRAELTKCNEEVTLSKDTYKTYRKLGREMGTSLMEMCRNMKDLIEAELGSDSKEFARIRHFKFK
ncbi:MAG: hypothetical protein OIF50_13505 [Flavobacteriaceae bacterium]|nr:hypothetical protein [Flavobacteriaceae bacterium]